MQNSLCCVPLNIVCLELNLLPNLIYVMFILQLSIQIPSSYFMPPRPKPTEAKPSCENLVTWLLHRGITVDNSVTWSIHAYLIHKNHCFCQKIIVFRIFYCKPMHLYLREYFILRKCLEVNCNVALRNKRSQAADRNYFSEYRLNFRLWI